MNKFPILVFFFVFLGACNGQGSYRVDLQDFTATLEAGGKAKEIELIIYTPTKNKNEITKERIGTITHLYKKNGTQLCSNYDSKFITSQTSYEYDENGLHIETRSIMETGKAITFVSKSGIYIQKLLNRKNNKETWVEGEIDSLTNDFVKGEFTTAYYEFSRHSLHEKKGKLETITKFNDQGQVLIREIIAPMKAIATFVYDDKGLLIRIETIKKDEGNIKNSEFVMEYEYPEFDEMNNWTKCIKFNGEDNTYEFQERKITYW